MSDAIRKCSAEECNSQVFTRGWCAKHYQQWRRANAAPCSITGCKKPSRTRGMCKPHWRQWHKENGQRCTLDNCDKPHEAKGFCQLHYIRWKKTGDPLNGWTPRFENPAEALAQRSEWQADCLVWTGYINDWGYGVIRVEDKAVSTHRYAWQLANGPIPEGMELDHICHNPACCNVAHLRIASREQNAQNLSGAMRTNKSTGVRNVYKRGDKYRVILGKGGKLHHFGSYSSLAQASEVAAQAREELFGAFAGKG